MTKKIETKKEAAFVVGYQTLKSAFQLEKNFCWALFTRRRGSNRKLSAFGFSKPEKEKWGRKLASDLSPSRALIH